MKLTVFGEVTLLKGSRFSNYCCFHSCLIQHTAGGIIIVTNEFYLGFSAWTIIDAPSIFIFPLISIAMRSTFALLALF